MPSFGPASLERLNTCHGALVSVCVRVIVVIDFTVIWGRRGQAAQDEAFRSGNSRAPWPESKHNTIYPVLSDAVDIAPWHPSRPHIRWENKLEFARLAGHMMQVAGELKLNIRWGADWDMDDDLYDKNLPFDLGHFEIMK